MNFANAVALFRQAREQVYTALDEIVQAEMAKLAALFPKRYIELHSGMGMTTITIERRGGYTPDDYKFDLIDFPFNTVAHGLTDWVGEVPAPVRVIFHAMNKVCEELEVADPGYGSIFYRNNVKMEDR